MLPFIPVSETETINLMAVVRAEDQDRIDDQVPVLKLTMSDNRTVLLRHEARLRVLVALQISQKVYAAQLQQLASPIARPTGITH